MNRYDYDIIKKRKEALSPTLAPAPAPAPAPASAAIISIIHDKESFVETEISKNQQSIILPALISMNKEEMNEEESKALPLLANLDARFPSLN